MEFKNIGCGQYLLNIVLTIAYRLCMREQLIFRSDKEVMF